MNLGWKIEPSSDKGPQPVPDDVRRQRGRSLPAAAMDSDRIRDPAGYEADQSLIDAIHAAVILGQPLLITGEPGCGKTEVANFVAYQFGLDSMPNGSADAARPDYALRFDVKSTTTARDLFYSFDTVGRFGAAYDREGAEARQRLQPSRFISLHALGQAIIDAAPWDVVGDLVGIPNNRRRTPEQRRSVVLIDEVDKAPRDVPNDLLMEFDRLSFHIGELDRTIHADGKYRPILVITSNSERALPEAFLRRCVFHALPFPGRERLTRIVHSRLGAFSGGKGLEQDAIDLLLALRREQLHKPPAVAELLAFISVVLDDGLAGDASLARDGAGWEAHARSTLLKTADDQERFREPGSIAELLNDFGQSRPEN